MAGRTPEKAVDAFLGRVRTTLTCLSDCTALGSGFALEHPHVLTAFEPGTPGSNLLRLMTHDGTGEIILRFVHGYRVVHVPEDEERGPYKVSTQGYQYRLTDIADSDLVIYDWHPEGNSPVTTPHLHVPPAGAFHMAQEAGCQREGKKTHLGDVHFPTARIFLEDVVELLIRDFAVVPNCDDWEDVLRENRSAIQRGRTW